MSTLILILSPADRQRLGAPERLPVDVRSLTAREAATLQRPVLPGHEGWATPAEWRQALLGHPIVDEHGAPVTIEVPDRADGTRTVQARRPDFAATLALVWLALRRAGITTALDELDVDVDGLLMDADLDEEEEPEGKDDSPGEERISSP